MDAQPPGLSLKMYLCDSVQQCMCASVDGSTGDGLNMFCVAARLAQPSCLLILMDDPLLCWSCAKAAAPLLALLLKDFYMVWQLPMYFSPPR